MSGQGDAGMSESILGNPAQPAPARTVEQFWVHMVAMEQSMRELIRMREEDQELLQRLENRIDELTGHKEEEADAKPSGSGKGKEREPEHEPEREPKTSDTPEGEPPARTRHSGPKVKIPDAYNGKAKGKAAKQWWVRMMVAQSLMDDKFESQHQKLLWVLNNMEDKAADWALPLLMNLSSDDLELPATRSLETLGRAFITSFGDPDAERAAERKITSLEQTTSTAEYTTEFQALAADLGWNDKAFMAQYRRGLHWKVKELISQLPDQPRNMQSLIETAVRIDNVRRENEENRPKRKETPRVTTKTTVHTTPLTESPNFVSKEEKDCRQAAGLCIKCGKAGHSMKDCQTGWRAPSKETKTTTTVKEEKKKDSGKVAEVVDTTNSESDSDSDSEKD